VGGVPLFQLAREGKFGDTEISQHEVELYNAEFISRRTVSGSDLISHILPKINLVSGDFRQEEIIERWKDVLSKCPNDTFTIDRVRAEVSSGFYVRQFAADVAEKLGTITTTFHIKREKVGEFAVEK
jgi:tRNA U55 pseudouridine synthase TruB